MWEVRVTPAGDFDNHAFKSNHFEVRPLDVLDDDTAHSRDSSLDAARARWTRAGACVKSRSDPRKLVSNTYIL